ncbi:MAG: hypothetical protein QMC74_01095 [Myxococcota bacterium]
MATAAEARPNTWSAERLFDLLPRLGQLRVISVCGPSVFEAICEATAYELLGGSINMITPAFHWHFAADRLGHLQSHDTIHRRSGRRVLFFELREHADQSPFLRIYVYRAVKTDFATSAISNFIEAHSELSNGIVITQEKT